MGEWDSDSGCFSGRLSPPHTSHLSAAHTHDNGHGEGHKICSLSGFSLAHLSGEAGGKQHVNILHISRPSPHLEALLSLGRGTHFYLFKNLTSAGKQTGRAGQWEVSGGLFGRLGSLPHLSHTGSFSPVFPLLTTSRRTLSTHCGKPLSGDTSLLLPACFLSPHLFPHLPLYLFFSTQWELGTSFLQATTGWAWESSLSLGNTSVLACVTCATCHCTPLTLLHTPPPSLSLLSHSLSLLTSFASLLILCLPHCRQMGQTGQATPHSSHLPHS